MANGTVYNVKRTRTSGERKFYDQVGKIIIRPDGASGVLFLNMFESEFALFKADPRQEAEDTPHAVETRSRDEMRHSTHSDGGCGKVLLLLYSRGAAAGSAPPLPMAQGSLVKRRGSPLSWGRLEDASFRAHPRSTMRRPTELGSGT